MQYAVILAGGAGKRLWPLSRLSRPKQLLPLINGRSLMELAVQRLDGLYEPQNIYIVTSADYVEQVSATLPSIPRQNIIPEPQGRDTANAIALATQLLYARDPEGTMAVFTADHVIRPADLFVQTVRAACQKAQQHPDGLFTFGIRPSWPHTGLGYIHCGEKLEDGIYRVLGFQEKPDHQTARRYVESGRHYWNSGMFVWKLSAIRAALQKFLGDSMAKLEPVAQAVREGRDYRAHLEAVYPQLQRISIDYAVMEKADKVLMVELNCEWLDVGSWPSLETVADTDEGGNVAQAQNIAVLDSFRNIIVSEDDHLLAVLGIDDCIIVHSANATLVCNKGDSQRLKELVALIEQKYGKAYV